jgi:putative flippase GtrA
MENVTKRGVLRFVRYSVVGIATFLFDLALLYYAVQFLGIPYYAATPLAFLVAVSCNYSLSRSFVFSKTERRWHTGYLYFIAIALIGAFLTTALVVFLVAKLGLFYIVARVLTAGLIGSGNYFFNLYWNFKVAGKH